MGIITFLIVLIIVGLIWWLVRTYLPLPAPVKTVIDVVGVLILIIMLLQLFGIGTGIHIK